jgi:serine/threonine-protein kinase
MPPSSPADWSAMLDLRSGSLLLQGLDIVIADPEARRGDRVAAVGLRPGTNLTIADCTLTVAVPHPSASILVVQPPDGSRTPGVSGAAAGRGCEIEIRDSFLRSGGDGVLVAPGREVSLGLTNALIATDGSLLHALGGPRRPAAEPAVKARIDRVTARVKGGLVRLESTPEEPGLTPVDLRAENAIVSTTAGDDPLFRIEGQVRVEGQEQLDPLGDKIRWEARKVAYHRIKTYRRDEIIQTGSLPRTYDRESWTRAFLPRDELPMLGDARFLHEADAALAAWKLGRDDLRLAPESPAAGIGPDLDRIPSPPPDDL